jgi:2-polyprenyl-3-methyl-5-hydroxy-6-metoxy-1,4-benzoquinol methylase
MICPVCGTTAGGDCRRVPYPKRTGNRELAARITAITLCNECGAGFVESPLNDRELETYYRSGDFWPRSRVPRIRRGLQVPYLLARSRWKSIESCFGARRKGIELVDIGAGYGFLSLAASAGNGVPLRRYTCVEPDPGMRESARLFWEKRGGNGNFEAVASLEEAHGPYDAAALSHVLEHVRDPLELVRSASSMLIDRGILLIEVPHEDYRFKLNVFPHLLFFNARSLDALIRRAGGLTVQSLYVYGPSMAHAPMAAAPSLASRAADGLMKAALQLPGALSFPLVKWRYGIARHGADGIWLRAVCIKERRAS